MFLNLLIIVFFIYLFFKYKEKNTYDINWNIIDRKNENLFWKILKIFLKILFIIPLAMFLWCFLLCIILTFFA